MKGMIHLFVFTSFIVVGGQVRAQPLATPNTGDIGMISVLSLNQKGIGPKVVGGRPAKSTDWPASFYSASAGSRCTATLIGPRVLLLAAHCVGNGKEASIEIVGKPQPISGVCTHAKEYKGGSGDASADYALCLMKEPSANIVFETINTDSSRVQKGGLIQLTGYGCTATDQSGGNDGVYRIGETNIVALPAEPENELNTILTRDKIMVCPGDSGGGAYIFATGGRRLVVSVNSRVWFDKGQSYLSSLSTVDGLAFLTAWSKDNGYEKICGLNLQGKICR